MSGSAAKMPVKVQGRDVLAGVVARRQARGERAVFTNGVFDLLHVGHVNYLRRARDLGDFLVLGLNSDASTRRLKGPARPLVPQGERAEVLAALEAIAYITIFDEETAGPTVALLRPAVYVKGADYAGTDAAARGGDHLIGPEVLRAVVAGDTMERAGALAAAEVARYAGLGERLPEARVVAEYGGSVALLTYLAGHSTSELIERIVARYGRADSTREG